MRLLFAGIEHKKVPRELLRTAAEFYGSQLMTDRVLRTLKVTIRFSDNTPSNEVAYVLPDGTDKPKNFIITLSSKARKKTVLEALAHEYVHIKQFATGEMKYFVKSTNTVKWQNQVYRYEDDTHEDESYWDQPWEIEALGREHGLYVKLRKYLKANA